jgi:hypothetical protein
VSLESPAAGRQVADPEPIDPHNRRKYRRVVVEIPGKVFVPSRGKEGDCTIKNVSPAGAEIASPLDGLLDTDIILYAAGLGRFVGHVVWAHSGRHGVKFNSTELKQARLASRLDDHVERRQQPRTKESRIAQFTREDGTIAACTIRDFSTGGVLVQSTVRPRIGEFILMGGMVGCVVRIDAAGIGIEFVEREPNDAEFKRSLESLDHWRTENSN